MSRAKTPLSVADFPLIATVADASTLEVRLGAAVIYNAAHGESFKRLDAMRRSRVENAKAMRKGEPKSPERRARSAAFKAARQASGFTTRAIRKFAC
jgi:hypothetical protein